jgi:hypothetical protein
VVEPLRRFEEAELVPVDVVAVHVIKSRKAPTPKSRSFV